MSVFSLDDIIDEPVAVVEPVAETDDKTVNQATQVVHLMAETFDFFRDSDADDTQAFYAVPKGVVARPTPITETGRKTLSMARSLAFEEFGKAVSTTAIQEGVKTLFALLECGTIESTPVIVALRSAVFRDDDARIQSVVIDLAEQGPAVIVVDAQGWRIEENGVDGVLFRDGGRPLTRPSGAGDYAALMENLGFTHDSPQGLLVRGWLAAAFIADIERPMLLFAGVQGSGKTTRAAAVMTCIDPPREVNGSAVIGGNLNKVGDAEVKAANSYLVGYDNLSRVTQEQSDHIARLVTGDAIEKRALYSDGSLYTVAYKRTGLVTCISVPNFASDAMERFIIIRLERFADGERIGRAELAGQLAVGMPAVMAAILNDLSTAIRHGHQTVDSLPRMGDYYSALMRIDTRLADAYLDAFYASEQEQAEASLFVQVCVRAVAESHNGVVETEGLEPLYNMLRNVADRAGRAYLDNFPQTPRALGTWLATDSTLLRAAGIEATKRKAGGVRHYGLRKVATAVVEVETDTLM